MNNLNTDMGFNQQTLASFNTPERSDNDILGRIGHLEVRLASDILEIEAAQSLRYRVFTEELGARLPVLAAKEQRDFDRFDAFCEHFILIDTLISGPVSERIVGTYRLMHQDVARIHEGFYSQNEYDVSTLVERHSDKRFVELGRSCVLPAYRTRRSIELLWHGIWSYIRCHNIDVMFGCASFMGVIPQAHAEPLSFLYHTALASEAWLVKASQDTGYLMDIMPFEAIFPYKALMNMPPLIKGYIRLGAMVSPEAVVDHDFNTTDVLIVLPISRINTRYINHYGVEAERFAI